MLRISPGKYKRATGKKGREISTHDEKLSTGFHCLRDGEYASAGKVGVIKMGVETWASASLVSRLRTLIGIRSLRKLFQACDCRWKEVAHELRSGPLWFVSCRSQQLHLCILQLHCSRQKVRPSL